MNAAPSWVGCVDASESDALAALRLRPGLEVAPLANTLWLRGPSIDEDLDLALRKIPSLRRFALQADGQLIADGARVPEGYLPALRWQLLRDWLPLALPASLGGGAVTNRVAVRLVRSVAELPANALLTGIRVWHDWAEQAPAIRLRPLRFAAAGDGRVWVEGTPLPALPGARFHRSDGVAIPCGWKVEPHFGTAVLRRWLALAEDDTAFAQPDGKWETLKAEQFVPAMRSAVRLTAEALGHE
jgi:hypothetical protein